MTGEIVVALIACAGTLIGSLAGILASNRLTVYRIEQLEKKVDKHNTIVERTYKMENDIKTAFIRIDEIKEAIVHQKES